MPTVLAPFQAPFRFVEDDAAFTATLAKRNGAGPFAAGPLVQSDWLDAMAPDIVNFPRGDAIGNPFVSVVGAFTRINAAAIYAANDCVTDVTPAPITFTNCARAIGTSGLIISAVLVTDSAPALKGDFDLHLFHTTLVPQADNAPFGPSDAEALTCVGWIKFDTYSTTATNTIYWAKACYVPFTCAAADRNLYGVFAVRNAYTPVANAVYTVLLEIQQY